MLQFYKKRDFNTLISDTFSFFRLYGKNYIKNFILINGLILILLVGVVAFGFKEIFAQLFDSNMDGSYYYFEEYFATNTGTFIVTCALVGIIYLIFTAMLYTFPVFYMKRVANGQTQVKTDDILSDMKNNIGKIIVLMLGLLFVFTPIAFIVMGISYTMILLFFIGLLLLFFLVPVFSNWAGMLMFDYFHTSRGFFGAFSYGFSSLFSYNSGEKPGPFWKYWGSSAIMFLIYNTLVGIFTFVPIMFITASSIIAAESGENPTGIVFGGMGIVIFLLYCIGLIIQFLLVNLIMVNIGFIYYDSRTDLHKLKDLEDIQSIGVHEE